MYKTSLSVTALLLSVFGATASAKVKPASLFTDHMVLQGQIAIPVWGWADAGERVSVSFGGKTESTVAGADGAWRVNLPAAEYSDAPRELVITGNNTVTLKDVLVGDVWLASGQSNMGFPLNSAHNAAEEIPKANDPQIRFFKVKLATAAEPLNTVSGNWEACTSQSAANFSAVAYLFARDIRASVKHPIGVIGSYWGGTACQAWTPISALQKTPPMQKFVDQYEKALAAHKAAVGNPSLVAEYEKAEKKWKAEVAPGFNAANKQWTADSAAARASGKPIPPKPVPATPEPINPDPTALPNSSSRPGVPSVIYNAMIDPCAPYAIKGVIWYQGEANGGAGLEYRDLFPRLIAGWRQRWGQGDFPFLYVQLPNWSAGGADHDEWAYLREAQQLTLSLPNTGMAVTIDIGDPNDVHPKDKLHVAQRLALVARHVIYGQTLDWSGPMFESLTIQGAEAHVRLNHAEGGLSIAAPPWQPAGAARVLTDEPTGFVVAGEDHVFHPAHARLADGQIIVTSADVAHPVAVRYGWLNSPVCNVYGKSGLPLAPFRTDDWSATVAKKK